MSIEKKEEGRTEGETGVPPGLLTLAKEVAAQHPETAEAPSTRAETVAAQELETQDRDDFNTGRFQYYALVGDLGRLNEEKAPQIYGYQRSVVYMGTNQVPLGHPLRGPEDFLEAFDEFTASIDAELGTIPEGEVDLDAFYRDNADEVLFYDREETAANLRRKEFIQPKAFRVRDFPKEVAFRLYSRIFYSPHTKRSFLEAKKESIRKSLEGFSKAALDAVNIETALDGYWRLGQLKSPEVVGKVREVMEKLGKSNKPEDQAGLRRISRKIIELNSKPRP